MFRICVWIWSQHSFWLSHPWGAFQICICAIQMFSISGLNGMKLSKRLCLYTMSLYSLKIDAIFSFSLHWKHCITFEILLNFHLSHIFRSWFCIGLFRGNAMTIQNILLLLLFLLFILLFRLLCSVYLSYCVNIFHSKNRTMCRKIH